MYRKRLRSTPALLAMSMLFAGGAIAQDGSASCVKYSEAHANPALVSVRLGDRETPMIEVHTGTKGHVTSCSIVKGSGSERTDGASCDWIKTHPSLLEHCQKGQRPR